MPCRGCSALHGLNPNLKKKNIFCWQTGNQENRTSFKSLWKQFSSKCLRQTCRFLSFSKLALFNLAINFFLLLESFRSLKKLKVLSIFLLELLVQFRTAQWTNFFLTQYKIFLIRATSFMFFSALSTFLKCKSPTVRLQIRWA